ncbi:hypothetical protein EDD11_000096 [Mortierella claussenii]|nr:hypothetical protein EDD11_000096 [Mortierella claussenii]
MDDFFQFMGPLEGADNNANDRPSTRPETLAQSDATAATGATSTGAEASSSASPATLPPASSRTSWSAWGASFNKLLERGKKDMNEFVDVTRKDLTELVHTVQQEHSVAIESITKKVGDLKTTLPPIPASVNTASQDILGRVSTVVGGLKQEIADAATVIAEDPAEGDSDSRDDGEGVSFENKCKDKDAAAASLAKEFTEGENIGTASTATTSPSTNTSARGDKTTPLSFASTASLLTAGASTLTQTLTSSTKDLSSTANELFKRKLPAAAEKQLADADLFLKSTTESLKTNGLLAEQYVNKFGAGMANFLNSAVTISAPENKKDTSASGARNKRMFFDRKAAILEKLRMNPETYTVDPMTSIADTDIVGLERYKYFLQTFNMAEYQQRISRLLNEYPELKALMTKLVPLEVADEELFWQRYYFRLFEIEEEEKRRQKLVQEAGADLAEEEFTWDDNDDEDDDSSNEPESSGGQGSVTPKAEKKNLDTTTPRASQILSSSPTSRTQGSIKIKREPLTAEALASSLSALPIPDEAAGSDDGHATKPSTGAAESESEDDGWGSESLKSTSSPSAKSLSVAGTATHSKSSTTNQSSTRTSEDAYEVVDGVETPVRVPVAPSITSISSAASSPALEQSAHHQDASSKIKSPESKEEDDWSDWE